jgi:hypothetical protein
MDIYLFCHMYKLLLAAALQVSENKNFNHSLKLTKYLFAKNSPHFSI